MTRDSPLRIEVDPRDGVDEEAAKILTTHYGVILTLELIHDALAEDDVPAALSQEHVDGLEAAFRTGQRLRKRPDYEAFLADGPAALPDDVAATVYETLAPLAPAYGVDLEREPTAVDAVLETIRTVHGRRGS